MALALSGAQGQGFTGAGHRHVIQAPFLVVRGLPAAGIQDQDMIELQAFGPMRGEQQRAAHAGYHSRRTGCRSGIHKALR